jgi:hypothetical protein
LGEGAGMKNSKMAVVTIYRYACSVLVCTYQYSV